MLDIKKLLTNMLNKTIRSVTVPNLSTDSNGYMQLPSSLDNAILVWAETDSHAGITEHPYFLNNPPSYPTKHSMRFKQWDEQALYKNTTKTVTVWYIPGGGYSVIAFMSTIAHLAERWWRYVRRQDIADEIIERHNIYVCRNGHRIKHGCVAIKLERNKRDWCVWLERPIRFFKLFSAKANTELQQTIPLYFRLLHFCERLPLSNHRVVRNHSEFAVMELEWKRRFGYFQNICLGQVNNSLTDRGCYSC